MGTELNPVVLVAVVDGPHVDGGRPDWEHACVIHLSFNLNCKPTNQSPLSAGLPAGEASVIKKQKVFGMESRSLTPVTYCTQRDKESCYSNLLVGVVSPFLILYS